MIERLIETLTGNPVYLAGAVVLALIILFGVIKKLLRLALVMLAVLVLFAAWLVWTNRAVPTDLDGLKQTLRQEVLQPARELVKGTPVNLPDSTEAVPPPDSTAGRDTL